MGAVAERLVRRSAAAAQRERPFRDLVGRTVPVHYRHVIAFYEIRSVLSHSDRRHGITPFSASTPGSRRWSRFSSFGPVAVPSLRPPKADSAPFATPRSG